MEKIKKKLSVPVSSEKAFRYFVYKLDAWWPKEYTWSQDGLHKIKIEPKQNGLCTEIGPYNFRCDWGRVTVFDPYKRIIFKWQISPARVPEPDPKKASEVKLKFIDENYSSTIIDFEHSGFEKHGEEAEEYKKTMDSDEGWDYILDAYIGYCKNN